MRNSFHFTLLKSFKIQKVSFLYFSYFKTFLIFFKAFCFSLNFLFFQDLFFEAVSVLCSLSEDIKRSPEENWCGNKMKFKGSWKHHAEGSESCFSCFHRFSWFRWLTWNSSRFLTVDLQVEEFPLHVPLECFQLKFQSAASELVWSRSCETSSVSSDPTGAVCVPEAVHRCWQSVPQSVPPGETLRNPRQVLHCFLCIFLSVF